MKKCFDKPCSSCNGIKVLLAMRAYNKCVANKIINIRMWLPGDYIFVNFEEEKGINKRSFACIKGYVGSLSVIPPCEIIV